MLCCTTEMRLYHAALRDHSKLSDITAFPSPLPDSIQLESLSACLGAGMKYLDAIIATPTEEFHLITFAEWVSLQHVIIAMANITIPSEKHPPQWDIKAAQDRLKLNLYLESLCYRMQDLTTFNPPAQPHPDYWISNKVALQSIRSWYKSKTDPGASIFGRPANKRPAAVEATPEKELNIQNDTWSHPHPADIPAANNHSSSNSISIPHLGPIPDFHEGDMFAIMSPQMSRGMDMGMGTCLGADFDFDQILFQMEF